MSYDDAGYHFFQRRLTMCLAVPGKIIKISRDEYALITGTVSFGGVLRDISLDLVPEAVEGDYVIVHAGTALSVLDEDAARETLALLNDIAASNTEQE
jgi:hydrogenase expression/formation protein HypC